MTPKIKGLLGLARKAGKLSSGDSQVEALLKKKKGSLLIIASDAPGMTAKYVKWAEDLGLPVMVMGSKKELGLAVGLSPRAVILVTDKGFADAILKARG